MIADVPQYRGDGVQASGTITVNQVPTNGSDTISVNGITYTAGTDFRYREGTYGVATAITAMLNADPDLQHLHSDTDLWKGVNAQQYGNVVRIWASAPGTAGNSIALATNNTTTFTLSGSTLTGGSA